MEFALSGRGEQYRQRMASFMDDCIYPVEREMHDYWLEDPNSYPPVMAELRSEARRRGLWNLYMKDPYTGDSISNVEYATVAELSGMSPFIAPAAMNCQAPDSGNGEIIAQFGSQEVKDRYLKRLLDGEIGSCFSMTEPLVASSDPANLQTTIIRDGDEYVVNGRKWWTGHAAMAHTEFAVVLGVTNPEADHRVRQSMVIVPIEAPGVKILRTLPVFGFVFGGQAEMIYDNVRIPASYVLGGEGQGAMIAQARLGPGRIHHAMRCVGMAQRCYELMCKRVHLRSTFGTKLSDRSKVQHWIARSWLEIEQTRLLVLKAAWLIDTQGAKRSKVELGAVKIAATNLAVDVANRAIQVFGAAGVSSDFPMALFYSLSRSLQIGDGPDEVHEMTMARREVAKYAGAAEDADHFDVTV